MKVKRPEKWPELPNLENYPTALLKKILSKELRIEKKKKK